MRSTMPMRNPALATAALLALSLAACATPPPPRQQAGIEEWSQHHPAASQELGAWVQQYPDAASLFFEWDGHHPERAREFVTWTIYHPGQPIEGFVVTHPGWQYFDRISSTHRAAADVFMAWCRRRPQAAEALMNHPGGLNWAGTHLYAGMWHMENPGR
jgi:hypothetical protein